MAIAKYGDTVSDTAVSTMDDKGQIMEQSAFIYLDDVVEKKEPIYVRNTMKEPGVIVLTFPTSHGKTHRQIIPNTRVPICLSNDVTFEMIRQSTSLRKCLNLKVLSLVDRKKAEMELSDPDAREALEVAYNRVHNRGTREATTRLVETMVIGKDGHQQMVTEEKSDSVSIEKDTSSLDGTISTRVTAIITALVDGNIKARDAKSELFNLELSSVDLSYIISNCPDGIVKTFAKKRMASLQA